MSFKFASFAAGVAMLAFAPAAFAADMPVEQPYQAVAPVVEPTAYNWTGLYIGAHGGFGWGSFDSDTDGEFDGDGAIAGGQIGYNWQYGQWLVGLEGDASWTDMSSDEAFVDAQLNWLSTIRGRVGWTFDRVLFYGTGGVAFGDVDYSNGFDDDSQTQVGWAAGAGIEFAVTENFSLRAEYLHVDLGDEDFGSTPSNVSFDADIARGGVNYRF